MLGDVVVAGIYIGGYQPQLGTDNQEFTWLDGTLYHVKPFPQYSVYPDIDPDKRCLAGRWTNNAWLTFNTYCDNTDYLSLCRKSSGGLPVAIDCVKY